MDRLSKDISRTVFFNMQDWMAGQRKLVKLNLNASKDAPKVSKEFSA